MNENNNTHSVILGKVSQITLGWGTLGTEIFKPNQPHGYDDYNPKPK